MSKTKVTRLDGWKSLQDAIAQPKTLHTLTSKDLRDLDQLFRRMALDLNVRGFELEGAKNVIRTCLTWIRDALPYVDDEELRTDAEAILDLFDPDEEGTLHEEVVEGQLVEDEDGDTPEVSDNGDTTNL